MPRPADRTAPPSRALVDIVLREPTGARARLAGLSSDPLAARVAVVLVVVAVATAIALLRSTEGSDARDPGASALGSSAQGAAPVGRAASAAAGRPQEVVPAGTQLAVGRIVAVGDPVAGTLVVRARTTNLGRSGVPAGADAVLLIDGQLVATEPIGRLSGAAAEGGVSAGARADLRFELPYCATGRHAVAVVVDTTAVLREADERDNARTSELDFGC